MKERRWLIFLLVMCSQIATAQVACDSLFDAMKKRWQGVENMTYVTIRDERVDGKMVRSEMEFTVQRDPFKVVGLMKEGSSRHYILYDAQLRAQEALYIPDGFPFVNLWLDVDGGTFRGQNHYTISDAGYQFIFHLMQDQLSNPEIAQTCKTGPFLGEDCYFLLAEYDDFQMIEYDVPDGETVMDIADKFHISAYLIMERNIQVQAYEQDCGGMHLTIPNAYAKKVRVVISATHLMPVYIEVFDDRGLLEKYQYLQPKFNLTLPEGQFTESYIDSLN